MTAVHCPSISETAFSFLAERVYRSSRIKLGRDKQALMVSRVVKRLRELALDSFEDYCRLLQSSRGTAETSHLVDAISTNHTNFFRENDHFQYLSSEILPKWTKAAARPAQPLRIWSAACSSGEEPYTLGMAVAEYSRARGPVDCKIDASDICTSILQRATAGIYDLEKMQLPSPELLTRYFQRGVGEFSGKCRIKADVQRLVTFHHLNLFQEQYPVSGPYDVIFCRNVMIYFDQPSIQTLVNRLADMLAPGGHLFVGLSESLLGIQQPLKSVRPGVYRRG